MRNCKQVDTEAGEERIKKRDILAVIFALAGVTLFIWGVM